MITVDTLYKYFGQNQVTRWYEATKNVGETIEEKAELFIALAFSEAAAILERGVTEIPDNEVGTTHDLVFENAICGLAAYRWYISTGTSAKEAFNTMGAAKKAAEGTLRNMAFKRVGGVNAARSASPMVSVD